MEKVKVTKKQMQSAYKNIVKTGYCTIQKLLYDIQPKFYSSGLYGWDCDYYIIDNDTILCTGYRPIGNIIPNYEIIKKYEEQAEKIINNTIEYKARMLKLEKLRNKFIIEVLKNSFL